MSDDLEADPHRTCNATIVSLREQLDEARTALANCDKPVEQWQREALSARAELAATRQALTEASERYNIRIAETATGLRMYRDGEIERLRAALIALYDATEDDETHAVRRARNSAYFVLAVTSTGRAAGQTTPEAET